MGYVGCGLAARWAAAVAVGWVRGGLRVGSVVVDRAVGRAAMRRTQPMGAIAYSATSPQNKLYIQIHIYFT